MQYVFTQEEMDEIRKKNEALSRLPTIEKLQEFCTFVADNLVLTSGWKAGHTWDCILTHRDAVMSYCDKCPAVDVCPYPWKQWSK